MITLRQGIQVAFLFMMLFTGLVCAYQVAFAVPGEPAGCAEETCKPTAYLWFCETQKGLTYDYADCIPCTGAGARCEDGSKVTKCTKDTGIPLKFADYPDAKEVCYCKGNPTAKVVQATGDYNDKYKDLGMNRRNCE